jgi:hypothetical protein
MLNTELILQFILTISFVFSDVIFDNYLFFNKMSYLNYIDFDQKISNSCFFNVYFFEIVIKALTNYFDSLMA